MRTGALAILEARRSRWGDAALVAGLLAAATAICLLLEPVLSITSQAMVYVLAVVVASYSTRLGAALACSLAAVTLLNYFFVPPRFGFRVEADENITTLFAMLALTLVISQHGVALRRETELARLNEARARQLQDLAIALAGISARPEVGEVAERFLAAAHAPGSRVMLLDPDGRLPAASLLPPDLLRAVQRCIAEREPVAVEEGDAAQGQGWCLPLVSDGHVEGAACVPREAVADARGREHARAICTLLGQALWRLKLSGSARAAEESSRWHRAQSTFLAAISHDFRTPLAAIVTAASSLQTQREKLGAQEQERLAGIILDEADHLATLTENTLQLARLENAGEIQRDWQSMEEIVGSVLARVRQRDAGGRIQSRVPAQLPLIQADPVLIAQLLENLLDNALKYSEGGVELEVTHAGSTMEVAVLDRGKSIAPDREETLFEPYRRSDRSGQRGAGLGLAVGRAIARAHGGDLRLHHRDGGGSILVLRLPVQQLQPAAEAA